MRLKSPTTSGNLSLLGRVGRTCYQRRWLTLFAWLVGVAVLIVLWMGFGAPADNTFTSNDLTRTITAYGTGAASTINQTWSSGLLQTMTDADGNITSNTYNGSRQETATQTTDPGATILDKLANPWGLPLYTAEDLEGRRWTFAQARPTM